MTGIIDLGVGNVQSLKNALEHLGGAVIVSDDPKELESCQRLILPGVGSFREGMRAIWGRGLGSFIKNTKKPLLGICLGYQIMSEGGDEGGKTPGLGLFPGWVVKLAKPHVGWDEWEGRDYYFVHHYANNLLGWVHQEGRVWGCQFHPEKSQQAGLDFLREFLDQA